MFGWLARAGGIAEAEMLRTFNCGIGMVLVVDRLAVDSVSEALRAGNEHPVRLGEIVAHAGGERIAFSGALRL